MHNNHTHTKILFWLSFFQLAFLLQKKPNQPKIKQKTHTKITNQKNQEQNMYVYWKRKNWVKNFDS